MGHGGWTLWQLIWATVGGLMFGFGLTYLYWVWHGWARGCEWCALAVLLRGPRRFVRRAARYVYRRVVLGRL